MFKSIKFSKIAFALLLILATEAAIAAISSGISDERNKNSKYSLRILSRYSHKFIPLGTLKADLLLSGSQIVSQNKISGGSDLNSLLQFYHGNTTYSFPYKFKIRVPKFKTPSRNN